MGAVTAGSSATVAATADQAPTPAQWSSRLARIVHSAPDLLASAMAGFSLPAIALLLLGHFSPGWVWPFGIAGAALAVTVCGIGVERVDRRAVGYTLAAIGLVLVWLVVNSYFTAENLYAHRDPATYNLAGRWLMDHSRMPIPTHSEVFGSPTGSLDASAGFGSPRPGEVYAQGNHLLPALLAVAGWLFGVAGLTVANVVFGAFALLIFFGLARRVVGAPLALLAMATLAVSMPLIFVSRDTYSEPLALLFVIGGLGLLHRAVESGRIRDFALAGLVVATVAPVRIDSYPSLLAVVVVGILLLAVAAVGTRRHSIGCVAALCGAGAVPTLLGWLDVTRLASGYYRDERHHIMPAIELGLVLVVLLPVVASFAWRPSVRRWLARPAVSRRLIGCIGVVIALAFAVLASRPLWLQAHDRPLSSVTVLQQAAGQSQDPTRSYDEQTLRWLAMYVGWPTLVLAAVGYFLLLRKVIRTRSLATIGMITMGLGLSALYLVSAQITPDQPWAMRRYVPIVLPVLLIAAAYTIRVLVRRPAVLIRAGAVALAVIALVVPAVVTAPMAGAREEVPQLTQVKRICAAVGPRGAVLEVDLPAQTSYSQTVRSYCDVPSIGLVDAQPTQLAQVRTAVASRQRVLFVLATDPTKIDFAGGTPPPVPFSVVRTTRWPSVLNKTPRHVDHEQVAVYLAAVRADGLAEPITRSSS